MPFYSTHRLTDLSEKSKYILPCLDPTSVFCRLTFPPQKMKSPNQMANADFQLYLQTSHMT